MNEAKLLSWPDQVAAAVPSIKCQKLDLVASIPPEHEELDLTATEASANWVSAIPNASSMRAAHSSCFHTSFTSELMAWWVHLISEEQVTSLRSGCNVSLAFNTGDLGMFPWEYS